MKNFMLAWVIFQLCTTLYLTFFVAEVDPAVEEENRKRKEAKKAKKELDIEMSPLRDMVETDESSEDI